MSIFVQKRVKVLYLRDEVVLFHELWVYLGFSTLHRVVTNSLRIIGICKNKSDSSNTDLYPLVLFNYFVLQKFCRVKNFHDNAALDNIQFSKWTCKLYSLLTNPRQVSSRVGHRKRKGWKWTPLWWEPASVVNHQDRIFLFAHQLKKNPEISASSRNFFNPSPPPQKRAIQKNISI